MIRHIKWKDNASIDAWTDANDPGLKPVVNETIGFVVKENDEVVVLASSKNENFFCCAMIIIKANILEDHEIHFKK